jgi:hypothetical protein
LVYPDILSLAVELQSPTIDYDYLVAVAESLGMALSIPPSSVNIMGGRTYIVCSSTNPATLDIYVGGALVARFTESGVQTLGGIVTSL